MYSLLNIHLIFYDVYSWSPDGQCLVSSHADNNAAPVAKIIERRGWKFNRDFVGHEKAVCSVVRL